MRNPVSVLHIGWWAPAIAALKGAGADVICVVTTNEAPSVRATGADTIVVPDPGSVEDILAGLARDSLRPADFSTICSGVEYYLVQAAVVAEIGGTQGAESAQMLAMRDKFVQKDLVRRAGVRTAACTLVESLDRLDLAAVSCPQVLKPLDGAGAKDTIVLRSPDHLREVIAATSAANRGPWLLEEFIPGQEFFADGVVRDGKITFFSLSGYLRNIIECHEGGIVAYRTLSQDEGPDLHTKTRTLAETAFRALGHEDGVFHLEVFWDGAEVVGVDDAVRSLWRAS